MALVTVQRRLPLTRVVTLLLPLLSLSCGRAERYEPRNGDIIFQTSRSAQSLAVQRATRSPYSHMGLVYLSEGKPYVFEAAATVKLTPLPEWIERGEGGHLVVKRLAGADTLLGPDALRRMLDVGRAFEGKRYDLYFEWSDDRLYCSELVWKVFQRALGLEVGGLQTIAEFDLSDPVVQEKIQERFHGPPPANEPVVSPAAIFGSDLLVTVFRN
jgi:hypothetical protein